jgi:hypothetical protein
MNEMGTTAHVDFFFRLMSGFWTFSFFLVCTYISSVLISNTMIFLTPNPILSLFLVSCLQFIGPAPAPKLRGQPSELSQRSRGHLGIF